MPADVRLAGDPVLHRPTRPVVALDDEARAAIAALLEAMRSSSHSVGVAAPQLGLDLRIAVVDVTGHPKARSQHGELVLVNPQLTVAGPPEVGREGCMSVPDLTGDVARASRVVVRALDAAGAEQVIEADAFEARALQHEIDHLDGRLFLDRLVAADRVFRRKLYR